MKASTKKLLQQAQEWCDDNDKSTEFMLQYMQDAAGVDLDCVIKFLHENDADEEHDHERENMDAIRRQSRKD